MGPRRMKRFHPVGPWCRWHLTTLAWISALKWNVLKQMKMNQRGLGKISGEKMKVDFAKPERLLAFSHSIVESGHPIGDLNDMLAGMSVPRVTMSVGHVLAARPRDLCAWSSRREAISVDMFISLAFITCWACALSCSFLQQPYSHFTKKIKV